VIKGLSAEFKDRLEIAQIPSSQKLLVEAFNVDKFPAMYSIYNKDGEVGGFKVKYDGKMSIRAMIKFCEEFALKEKVEPTEIKPHLARDLMVNLTKLNFEQETFYDEKVVLVHIHKGEKNHDLL